MEVPLIPFRLPLRKRLVGEIAQSKTLKTADVVSVRRALLLLDAAQLAHIKLHAFNESPETYCRFSGRP